MVRILLYMPRFHGYEDLVQYHLKQFGLEVNYIENPAYNLNPNAVAGTFRSLKKFVSLFRNKSDNYIKSVVIPQVEAQSYDIFLAINGYSVNVHLLDYLKHKNPKIKTILYLWDSSQLFAWQHLDKLFDKVFSFDYSDCKKYGYDYLPNFYIPTDPIDTAQDIDLFFVGTQTFDRYEVLKKINHFAVQNSMSCFFHLLIRHKHFLHAKWFYQLLNNVKRPNLWQKEYILNYLLQENLEQPEFVTREILSYESMQQQFQRSKTVLDIHVPLQTGYSHRVIYALAQGKKLLTSNPHIQNDPILFNSQQIRLFDRQNCTLDLDWICESASFDMPTSLQICRIDNWLKYLLKD